MRSKLMNRSAFLTTVLLANVALAAVAWSQPGTVLSQHKISNTQGNFTAVLHNLDEFGGAVVSLGDLDGAGPSAVALAVGVAGDDDGGTNRGALYVIFLDGAGNCLSQQKISDLQGNFTATIDNADEFGGALANLGDLDGAGPSVVALAVGAVGDDDGGTNRGAVYVLFLDSTGSCLSYQKISSTQGNFTAPLATADEFGGAVAALGDLDGAGPSVAALAVGATGDDDGGLDRGAAYVLFLDSAGKVLSYQKISNTEGNFTRALADEDQFASSVAGLGDLDGAGPSVGALAVGAIGDDGSGADRGAVYILFLNAAGSVLSSSKISDSQGNFTAPLADLDEFGGAVAALGDLDGSGPGVAALAVGAIGDDGSGSDRGAAYVLFLDDTGNVISYRKISDGLNFTGTLADGDDFGGSVAAIGDLDGSGEAAQTMVVGAAGDNDGGGDRGAVYVLSLAGGPTTATLLSLFEAEPLTGGVRLRWRFGQPEALAEAHLERATSAAGPWSSLAVEPSEENGTMTLEDRSVTAGSRYLYRLAVRTVGGASLVFGPLSATAGAAVSAFELAPVTPNPNHWFARVEYAVPYESRIRLTVLDVQGREVAVLADGMHRPGRHLRIWDGTSREGTVPAGVYFVRFHTAAGTFVRRTVLTQ